MDDKAEDFCYFVTGRGDDLVTDEMISEGERAYESLCGPCATAPYGLVGSIYRAMLSVAKHTQPFGKVNR